MSAISAFIAEDEPLAREALVDLVGGLPGWVVVGDAADGRAALEACLARPPDVLFTDIRMPILSGLELAAAMRADGLPTQLVFITAHDAHAVEAFRLAAIDYLLKPVAGADFRRCVERLEAQARDTQALARVDALLARERGWLTRLVVRSVGRIDVVPLSEVVLLRAEGNYVHVITRRGSYLHRDTLKSLEQRLDPAAWVQVHRSTIVPLREVRCVLRGPAGVRVALVDGAEVPVGATYLARLDAALAAWR
ncbi:MAG: LytR/AlgR family response regulator transcription factor [bacterium]